MALSSFVYIFFAIFKIKTIYQIFLGISVVGLIIGWFINTIYYNRYISIIANKIEKKYNQQHVISKLKEEIEMNRYQEDETKSVETIVTEKWVYKKEKVFNRPSDCAYFSKFIMVNRSIRSIYLMISIFKEGINQYERTPEIYIQFFNYLHGIRKFIFFNKTCFIGDEANEVIQRIDDLSEKVLFKSVKLVKTISLKYLIYNSALIYDMDKAMLAADNDSTNRNSNNFELMNIKNQAVQCHLTALNSLKNLMNSLRALEDPFEFDNVMSTNDELARLLSMGESTYKNFIIQSNQSKESLELYILFLKHAMNREDLAEKYIQKLEDSETINELENNGNNEQGNYDNNYERSEMNDMGNKKLISMKNNLLHKCQKPLIEVLTVMQITSFLSVLIGIICLIIVNNSFKNIIPNVNILVYGLQSPLVMNKINCGLRFITVVSAAGIHIDNITNYDPGVEVNVDYLEQEYLSYMYPFHSHESNGYITIHPINDGVIDEMREVNYYEVMQKVFRYSKLIFSKLTSEYMNPSFLYNEQIRFFIENSKGLFGDLFLHSLDLTEEFILNLIKNHVLTVYIITSVVVAFIIFIVIWVILPNVHKSYVFIRDMVYLFKTLPSSFFNEQSNEYASQVTKICENYSVDDEGVKKKAKNKKTSSTKKAKYLYILFCIITPIFLLYPFLTILIFKPEYESLTDLLVNSSRREYYLYVINMFCLEVYIKDRNYYGEGEELRILAENYKTLEKLEKELKNGKFGGRPSSEIEIFNELYTSNKCVRHPFSMWKCDLRVFDELYTEELANSPVDYMMVEYLSNLSDFVDEEHEKKYNLTDQEEIKEMLTEILANPRIQLLKKLSDDILGFIDQMNDIGITYLVEKLKSYKSNTLLYHISSSFIIYITFYLLVSRPIKKQLRAIDSLINIIFSIPPSVYKSSPRLKKFIENGELETNKNIN